MIQNNNYRYPNSINYSVLNRQCFVPSNELGSLMISMPVTNTSISLSKNWLSRFTAVNDDLAEIKPYTVSKPAISESNDKEQRENNTLSAEQLTQYAQQMDQARIKLSHALIHSTLGLQAMAKIFLQAQEQGIAVSELVNRNNSETDAVQDEGFVQDTAKQIESKLIECFQPILTHHTYNYLNIDLVQTRKYLSEIHFLPKFLQQVFCAITEQGESTLVTEEHRAWLNIIETEQQKMLSTRQTIISANFKLAPYIAKQYKNHGIAFNDLVQEGTVGLIKAVDRYDCKREVRFSTYAIYWIKQTISRAIVRQEKMVRLPYNLAAKAPLVLKAMREVVTETSQWPTIHKLAELCDIPEEEVQAIVNNYQPISSLNQSINENIPELMGTLEQHHYPQPLASLLSADLQSCLHSALLILSDREADVLSRRYGLGNTPEMTLQDIAAQLDLSRERVRQIQNAALLKLKAQFSDVLSDFLEAG
jgi:RNA polymerase primary sigma factor